jgi:hypothetical protein
MYSDFWADPTKQNIPAAWQGQDLAQITATVQSYTQQVIGAFAKPPADLGHAAERGRALATQLYKKIVIAETQYPWTLASGNSPIGHRPVPAVGARDRHRHPERQPHAVQLPGRGPAVGRDPESGRRVPDL